MAYQQRTLNNNSSVNPHAASQMRLNDLLDGVRKEFENLSSETSIYKTHQDEVDLKFNQQNQELANIRNTVYELEMAHRKIKEAYEEEILRLKQEIENRDRIIALQQLQLIDRPSSVSQQQQQLPPPGHSKQQSPQPPQTQIQNNGKKYYPQTPQQLPPPQLTQPQQAQQQLPPPPKQSSPNGSTPLAYANGGTPKIESNSTALIPQQQQQQAAVVSTPLVQTASQQSQSLASQHNKEIPQFLQDLDSATVSPQFKRQANDYYVLFNPQLRKKIDIDLVHSLDHSSVVCCVRFSKDGKFLATGCNKVTQVFGVETGELVARLSDDSASQTTTNSDGTTTTNYQTDSGDLYIRSVCFSPDGKFLATGAEDKLIRIWDLATRTIVKVLKGHEQDIYSLDFFPDGSKLVSGSGDRTVRIWDLVSSQCALTLSIEDGVTTVAVSPDGKLVAAGSLDRTVRVWDASTGFLVERLDPENENGNGHKDSVYSVTFTHDGKEITSGSLDRTVKLWSLNKLTNNDTSKQSSTCEVTYVGHKDFVLSVCATPDNQFILSGSKDRGVIIWDKLTGDPLLMLQGHRNSVISVSVSAMSSSGNGGYFATGSGDCKARIWKWTRV